MGNDKNNRFLGLIADLKNHVYYANKNSIPWSFSVERHMYELAPKDGCRRHCDGGVKMIIFYFGPGVDTGKGEKNLKFGG